MHEKLIKRLRELASIPEHCENVAACDQCPKEDICLSFTNKRIIEVATQAAADVVDRDEGIRIGAELAAMHGSDATSQDLERAYWTGYEEAMKKRDVRPVVRGRWVQTGGKYSRNKTIDRRILTCSVCGNFLHMEGVNAGRGDANFCPNCGADMREENNG